MCFAFCSDLRPGGILHKDRETVSTGVASHPDVIRFPRGCPLRKGRDILP